MYYGPTIDVLRCASREREREVVEEIGRQRE